MRIWKMMTETCTHWQRHRLLCLGLRVSCHLGLRLLRGSFGIFLALCFAFVLAAMTAMYNVLTIGDDAIERGNRLYVGACFVLLVNQVRS